MPYCKLCGLPASDDNDGWQRLQDHFSDDHGIEGWQQIMEHIGEDEPACADIII